MSEYEILSTVLACIAVTMSLVAWNGQRKLQREANDIQRATARLAEKQLEILLREEKGKNAARLSLALVREGKNHRLVLKNVSEVQATDVEIEPLLQRKEDNPIIPSEYAEKFPLKKLPPGAEVSLHALIFLSSPSAFNFRLSWKNPDGAAVIEEEFVSL
jgi:hypothetical protein